MYRMHITRYGEEVECLTLDRKTDEGAKSFAARLMDKHCQHGDTVRVTHRKRRVLAVTTYKLPRAWMYRTGPGRREKLTGLTTRTAIDVARTMEKLQ